MFQQALCSFRPDSLGPGYIVRRITGESEEVAYLCRRHPELFCDFLGCKANVPHRVPDLNLVGDKLRKILIAAYNYDLVEQIAKSERKCRDDVIRFDAAFF